MFEICEKHKIKKEKMYIYDSAYYFFCSQCKIEEKIENKNCYDYKKFCRNCGKPLEIHTENLSEFERERFGICLCCNHKEFIKNYIIKS